MKAKKIGIVGRKVGMTQLFTDEGLVGVTVVDFSDMEVLGKRTIEKDGYSAVILGCERKKDGSFRWVREIRLDDVSIYESGNYIDLFDNIKLVDVVGYMKGRGFAGAMKRHGFHGGPASHGAKHWHRRTGSVGGHTYPAKTWKGQKGPGHYGNTRVCVLNQKLVMVDKEKKLLFIKGAIPGAKNGIAIIRDAIKG
ncbi:MAG: 50S ribosomal protein L3 [Brevinematia bacterium]